MVLDELALFISLSGLKEGGLFSNLIIERLRIIVRRYATPHSRSRRNDDGLLADGSRSLRLGKKAITLISHGVHWHPSHEKATHHEDSGQRVHT